MLLIITFLLPFLLLVIPLPMLILTITTAF